MKGNPVLTMAKYRGSPKLVGVCDRASQQASEVHTSKANFLKCVTDDMSIHAALATSFHTTKCLRIWAFPSFPK
jgi:hypothetical protein